MQCEVSSGKRACKVYSVEYEMWIAECKGRVGVSSVKRKAQGVECQG
jgi:hypothetical protein